MPNMTKIFFPRLFYSHIGPALALSFGIEPTSLSKNTEPTQTYTFIIKPQNSPNVSRTLVMVRKSFYLS